MSFNLGVCPKCKDDNIILSRLKGIEPFLTKVLPISVCRCQNCHHRFMRIGGLMSYLGNAVYIAIFGLSVYVLFSQYKLNKGELEGNNYGSSIVSKKQTEKNVFESKVKPIAEKDFQAAVSEAIVMENEILEEGVSEQKLATDFFDVKTAPVAVTPKPKAVIKSKQLPEVTKPKPIKKPVMAKVKAKDIGAESQLSPNKPTINATKASKALDKRTEGVLSALASWRSAWQDQDVARYLGSYSRKMTSDQGAGFARWSATRKQRLIKPEWIRIEINQPSVSFVQKVTGKPQAVVQFQQVYRASNYSDVSRKELRMEKEGNNWNIVREQSL